MASKVAVATGMVPSTVNGKHLRTCVRRGVIERMRITALPVAAKNITVRGRAIKDVWQLFQLVKITKEISEEIGFAFRNRETGVFYVYE